MSELKLEKIPEKIMNFILMKKKNLDIAFNKYAEVVPSRFLDYAMPVILIGLMFGAPHILVYFGIVQYTPLYTFLYLTMVFGSVIAFFLVTELGALYKTKENYYMRLLLRIYGQSPVRTQIRINPFDVWELEPIKDQDGKKIGESNFVFVRKKPISPYQQVQHEEQLLVDESEENAGKRHYVLVPGWIGKKQVRILFVCPASWQKTFQIHIGKITEYDVITNGFVLDATGEYRGRTILCDYVEKKNSSGEAIDIEKVTEIVDIVEIVDSDWHFLNRQKEFMKKEDVMMAEQSLQYNIAMKHIDTIERLSEQVMHLSEELEEREMDFKAFAAQISESESESKDVMVSAAVSPLARKQLLEKIWDMVTGGAIVLFILILLLRMGMLG